MDIRFGSIADKAGTVLTLGLWWLVKKVAAKIGEKAAPKAAIRLVKKLDKAGVVPKELHDIVDTIKAAEKSGKLPRLPTQPPPLRGKK
jgi:hypothetical protein